MRTAPRDMIVPLPSIADVESYLQSKGWTRAIPEDPAEALPNARVYRGWQDIEGRPLTVLVPSRPDLLDAKKAIFQIVRLLALIEAVPMRDMARKIASHGSSSDGDSRRSTIPTKIAGIRRKTGPTKVTVAR